MPGRKADRDLVFEIETKPEQSMETKRERGALLKGVT